jgi:hypothetical protein
VVEERKTAGEVTAVGEDRVADVKEQERASPRRKLAPKMVRGATESRSGERVGEMEEMESGSW